MKFLFCLSQIGNIVMTFYCSQSKNQTFYHGLQLLQQSNLYNSSVHHSMFYLILWSVVLRNSLSCFKHAFFFFPQRLHTSFPAPSPSLVNSYSSFRFQLRHYFFHEIPLTSPIQVKDISITFDNSPIIFYLYLNSLFVWGTGKIVYLLLWFVFPLLHFPSPGKKVDPLHMFCLGHFCRTKT